ncbi:hypothetical protein JL720_16437 [Aureococcus anophagefferens]|nr:hypothetical protein JL720_16437 [Aureococcus anophagefferens]
MPCALSVASSEPGGLHRAAAALVRLLAAATTSDDVTVCVGPGVHARHEPLILIQAHTHPRGGRVVWDGAGATLSGGAASTTPAGRRGAADGSPCGGASPRLRRVGGRPLPRAQRHDPAPALGPGRCGAGDRDAFAAASGRATLTRRTLGLGRRRRGCAGRGSFAGLAFAHATWRQPSRPGGYVPTQSAVTPLGEPPGAVGVGKLAFDNCTFSTWHALPLSVGNASKDVSVARCRFASLAGGAIKLGNVDDARPSPRCRRRLYGATVVAARRLLRRRGEFAAYVRAATIEHNRSRTRATRVSLGWGSGHEQKSGWPTTRVSMAPLLRVSDDKTRG